MEDSVAVSRGAKENVVVSFFYLNATYWARKSSVSLSSSESDIRPLRISFTFVDRSWGWDTLVVVAGRAEAVAGVVVRVATMGAVCAYKLDSTGFII